MVEGTCAIWLVPSVVEVDATVRRCRYRRLVEALSQLCGAFHPATIQACLTRRVTHVIVNARIVEALSLALSPRTVRPRRDSTSGRRSPCSNTPPHGTRAQASGSPPRAIRTQRRRRTQPGRSERMRSTTATTRPTAIVELTITTFSEFGYEELIEEWNADNPDIQVEQTKARHLGRVEGRAQHQAGQPARASPTSWRSRATSCPRSSPRPTRWVDLSRPSSRAAGWSSRSQAATNPTASCSATRPTPAPRAICYRADLFEKAGLPTDRAEVAALMTTWEDYFALGEEFVAEVPDASGTTHPADRPGDAQPGRVPLRGVRRHRQRRERRAAGRLRDHHRQHREGPVDGQLPSGATTGPPPSRTTASPPCRARAGCAASSRATPRASRAGTSLTSSPAVAATGAAPTCPSRRVASTRSEATGVRRLDHRARAADQDLRGNGKFPWQVEALDDPVAARATNPYFNEAPAGQILSNRAMAITVQPYQGPAVLRHPAAFQDSIIRVDHGSGTPRSRGNVPGRGRALLTRVTVEPDQALDVPARSGERRYRRTRPDVPTPQRTSPTPPRRTAHLAAAAVALGRAAARRTSTSRRSSSCSLLVGLFPLVYTGYLSLHDWDRSTAGRVHRPGELPRSC